MRLLGAVLAGGRSSRFGSDKALALLNGKPLIDHVITALAAQTEAVVVCGKAWGDWVPDRPAPDMGPLGGINAALHCASARGYDAVLTAPCDVPLLPHDLVGRLGAAGFFERMPVIGLWPSALADGLDTWLADNPKHSVRRWAEAFGVRTIALDLELANINNVGDLDALSRG